MKRNNTDKLLSPGFMRMCVANSLLFASLYALLPVLPAVMVQKLCINAMQAGIIFLAFALSMFLVGPFNAYLGDAFKRKSVFVCATLATVGSTLGYIFVDTYPKLLLLASVQGAAFGLAATAGITVAIDITTSSRRSAGNICFAMAARLGMLVGVGLGAWLFRVEEFSVLAYASVLCAALSIVFALQVYVAFRAPIGVSRCNFDRFLLLRGWLPAVNLMLIALVPGVALPLIGQGDYNSFFFFVILLVLAMPFTTLFVNLSQHCQRGTANTTCHLFMDAGILIGVAVCCFLSDNGDGQQFLYTNFQLIYKTMAIGIIVAWAFFILLTYPYYKRKRVR